MSEVARKLKLLRGVMATHGLGGIRLRGVDWFAWVTGGSQSHVLLSADEGVADAFITPAAAYILTDAIEAPRFRDEETPVEFELCVNPWLHPATRTRLVLERAAGLPIASDRPREREAPLPASLILEKWRLGSDERERYRVLGRLAAEAMTKALTSARPDWTEEKLAAAGAAALWENGLLPDLILAAGEERMQRYRHPLPTQARLGERAMMVFCARRQGLYANLTRIVSFRTPTAEESTALNVVAAVEEAAFGASCEGASLAQVFNEMAKAYAAQGRAQEIERHHQGGVTGYRPREVIATPHTPHLIQKGTALAWNPSLPGMKIEDTVIAESSGVEVLTVDPAWPTFTRGTLKRPAILVRP